MSKFQLVMQMGPSPGKTISLGETEHYLGRDENNTIVVNDAELSRRHCHFIFTDGGFEIEDMGSTNGTFVNEKRTSGRYRLNLGDIIRLGDTDWFDKVKLINYMESSNITKEIRNIYRLFCFGIWLEAQSKVKN